MNPSRKFPEPKNIILASTSPYRAELLKKTGLSFTARKPQFDEEAAKKTLQQNGATPLKIAENLSKGKAHSLKESDSLIIAGDQLVQFNNEILGKAHTFEGAFNQLKKLSGETHELVTAVTILDGSEEWHINHITTLKMKSLSNKEIENYLKKDEPYDCAGSYKIERHGIILFDDIKTDDFSAIQGLPLIWISKILKERGYEFFAN